MRVASFAQRRSVRVFRPPVPAGLVPSMVLARSAGVAPLYVHFDASATTSAATSRPFHEVYYRWDFGDGSAASWTEGAALHSKNAAYGPIAGHIYETAGSFTATLYATDGVSSVSLTSSTITVTAADAATEFAGTNTVCVSTSGTFTGAPAGCTQLTTSDLQTAMAALTGSVKRLLFRAGETWTSGTATQISKNINGPVLIGKFGAGANPVWRPNAALFSGSYVLFLGAAANPMLSDWRIMDVELDGSLIAEPKNVNGFGGYGIDRLTLLRVTYNSITVGNNFSDSLLNSVLAANPTTHVWDQFAIVDCLHINPPNRAGGLNTGHKIYATVWSAERGFYAGNNADLQGTSGTGAFQTSHCMRLAYSYKTIVAHNTLANPGDDSARHHIKAHGPVWVESSVGAGDWAPPAGQLTTLASGLGYTRYLLISDNKLTQGPLNTAGWFISAQPQGGTPGNYSRNKDQIIQRNWIVAGSAHLASVMVQAEQCTIRNNVSFLTGANTRTAWQAHLLSPANGWICTDTWIYHNSSYHVDGSTAQAAINVGAGCTNSIVINNLSFAPNDATGSTLLDGGTGTVVAGNTANIQTDPAFMGPLSTLANWAVGPASYARNTGVSVPVWSDIRGIARATVTARDVGALQQ